MERSTSPNPNPVTVVDAGFAKEEAVLNGFRTPPADDLRGLAVRMAEAGARDEASGRSSSLPGIPGLEAVNFPDVYRFGSLMI